MRKSGLTGDEAYALSKHGKTTEDLGPLKKEIGLIKEDLEATLNNINNFPLAKKNLYPDVDFTNGYYYSDSNDKFANENYCYSDLLNINQYGFIRGQRYTVGINDSSITYQIFVCFYDNEKFISGTVVGNAVKKYIFKIPAKCNLLRLSTKIGLKEKLQIVRGEYGDNIEFSEQNKWHFDNEKVPQIANMEADIKSLKNNQTYVYTVAKQGGDFTSLLEAVIEATKHYNSTIYVNDGTYDIYQEFIDKYGPDYWDTYNAQNNYFGMVLKNRVKIIFSSNSLVKFNYTGNNNAVLSKFSVFNSGENGFTIENLNIECKNCRYCIHDERNIHTDHYINKYLNCNMTLDNSENTGWGSKQCIGGGLGTNGEIIIKDSVFKSVGVADNYGIISYHNSSDINAKSNIVISGNVFKTGTARISWYGESQKITTALITNNVVKAEIVHRAEDVSAYNIKNTEVISFNNVVN